jgi:bifunctional polynucleotide phosphatase/kinase
MDEDYIIYNAIDREFRSKLACFDLDHTLIQPKSKKVYPIDEKDWEFKENVINTLQYFHDNNWSIIIFSNQKQGGKRMLNVEQLNTKFANIEKKLKIPITVMAALKNDLYRKPMTGMWEVMDFFVDDYTEAFYCGDAYENKRFDDVYFAKNIKVSFMTPESVFLPKIEDFKVVDYQLNYNIPIDFITETQYNKEKKQIKKYIENLDYIFIISSPASGKTHFCKTHLPTYIRMSKDDYGKYLKEIKKLCDKKKKIVFDNTNHTEKSRKEILDILPTEADVGYIFREVDKEVSMYLNKYRYFDTHYSSLLLPEVAIHTYYKYLELPKTPLKVSHGIQKLEKKFYC